MKVGKGKLHSLKGEDNTLMATEPPKKKQTKKANKLETSLKTLLLPAKLYGKIVSRFFFFFFSAP